MVKNSFDKGYIEKIKKYFEKLECSQISDASCERVTILSNEFKNYGGKIKFSGPAFPINTHNDMLPPIQVLSKISYGAIIVINNSIPVNVATEALIGEIYVKTAIKYGAGGIIVNGAIRDVEAINQLPFPVYARTVTPLSSKIAKVPAKQVPDSVQIDKIIIHPGDWIFGDQDGILHIHQNDTDAVLIAADFIRKREKELMEAIQAGNRLEELIGLDDYIQGKSPLRFNF